MFSKIFQTNILWSFQSYFENISKTCTTDISGNISKAFRKVRIITLYFWSPFSKMNTLIIFQKWIGVVKTMNNTCENILWNKVLRWCFENILEVKFMRYFENISKNLTYNHHERIFQMSKNNNKAHTASCFCWKYF